MAERKTTVTTQSAAEFLTAIGHERVREECHMIGALMEAATGAPAEMWGPQIVGYGRRMIPYASGKTQEWMTIGFSPRKQNLTLYIPGGFEERGELLERLGVHACGKGCLYVKRLADINLEVLKELIETSVAEAGGASAI